jgi:serine/threonine protein phosphatase PrpC
LDAHTANQGDGSAAAIAAALHGGIFNLDANMRNTVPQLRQGIDVSGSTCIASFVTPTHIIVANLGDSRAVLSSDRRVRFATADHKPTDGKERNRIMQVGSLFADVSGLCHLLAITHHTTPMDYQHQSVADIHSSLHTWYGAGACRPVGTC